MRHRSRGLIPHAEASSSARGQRPDCRQRCTRVRHRPEQHLVPARTEPSRVPHPWHRPASVRAAWTSGRGTALRGVRVTPPETRCDASATEREVRRRAARDRQVALQNRARRVRPSSGVPQAKQRPIRFGSVVVRARAFMARPDATGGSSSPHSTRRSQGLDWGGCTSRTRMQRWLPTPNRQRRQGRKAGPSRCPLVRAGMTRSMTGPVRIEADSGRVESARKAVFTVLQVLKQPSVRALGAEGRRFESCLPDSTNTNPRRECGGGFVGRGQGETGFEPAPAWTKSATGARGAGGPSAGRRSRTAEGRIAPQRGRILSPPGPARPMRAFPDSFCPPRSASRAYSGRATWMKPLPARCLRSVGRTHDCTGAS